MPITEEERLKRKQYIGCSDLGAMLGLDPWRNAYDLWLDKTNRVNDDDWDNPAAEAGTLFEPGVIDWAEKSLGPLRRNVELINNEFNLIDHLDGQVISSGEPVEAKTSGLFGPLMDEWGDEYSDQLPDRVIVQCHGHMICTERVTCHVPTFLGNGRGFVMFTVFRDPVIADAVMDGAIDFWKYVEQDEAPPNLTPNVSFLKRLKRKPTKTIPIDAWLVEQLDDAKDKVKWAEALRDDATSELVHALGDAEAGTYTADGKAMMITYFEQSSNRIDATKLRGAYPKIADECTKTNTYRVLRKKKVKQEKTK
jgi:putative phage-type endonuclease